jgi:hypothetical protein
LGEVIVIEAAKVFVEDKHSVQRHKNRLPANRMILLLCNEALNPSLTNSVTA